MIKVEPSDGSVAIVHGPAIDATAVPKHVRQDTAIFFRAVWDDNDIIPSPENGCAGLEGCTVVANEGRCLCSISAEEASVFSLAPRGGTEDVLGRLRVGGPDPASFDAGTWTTSVAAEAGPNGGLVKVHHRRGEEEFSVHTVFVVEDVRTGRTTFLKNVESAVRVGGANKDGPSFRKPTHFISLVDRVL